MESESFDTVIDTFGLEFVQDPIKVLQEMRRVCKKDGLILLMEFGEPDNPILKKLQNWFQDVALFKYGRFYNRNWESIISQLNMKILK